MRCVPRCVIAVAWSPTARSPSSGCMTSSTRCVLVCRRRPATARRWRSSTPTGQAVLACAAAFAGRPPQLRSLIARAPGRLTPATAEYWVAAVARLPAAAGRCRAARSPAGPRPGPLPASAGRHRRPRRRDRGAAGRHRRADPDQPARGRGRSAPPRSRPQPADRPIPRRRAPLLGNRSGPGALPVRDPAPARTDLPTGPGRTPRRADGHRLGTVASAHPPSPNVTPSSAPAAWPPSRPASRWPATPAA